MDYLKDLNSFQKAAVTHTEGPCLVIAGAGSGKTRVLTYRIAHLIKEHKIDPFSILALTFTNKAANEMKNRIESIVGTDARSLWMGTFHSIFSRRNCFFRTKCTCAFSVTYRFFKVYRFP